VSWRERADKAGGAIAAVIVLWDRATSWLRKRKDTNEDRAAREKYADDQLSAEQFEYASDQANQNKGPCTREPGCRRPKFHVGECGPALTMPKRKPPP
jgi:hypothetical protein